METTLKLFETCEQEDLSRSSESSRTWSARRTKASGFFSHTGPLSPEECPFVNLDRRCAASIALRSSAPTPVLTTPRRVLQIHVHIRTLFVPVTLTSSGLVYSSRGAWLVLGLPWTKSGSRSSLCCDLHGRARKRGLLVQTGKHLYMQCAKQQENGLKCD